MRSCLDLYHAGVRKNGLYNVQYENETSFQVFCDFESEAAESVWTLVTSFSLQNSEAFRVPLYSSHARSEKNPNWAEYRYSIISTFIHDLTTLLIAFVHPETVQ